MQTAVREAVDWCTWVCRRGHRQRQRADARAVGCGRCSRGRQLPRHCGVPPRAPVPDVGERGRPVILRVSKQLGQYQEEVEALVRWGISTVLDKGDHSCLAVNVKSRPDRVTWEWLDGAVRKRCGQRRYALQLMRQQTGNPNARPVRVATPQLCFSGRAYMSVPPEAWRNWPSGILHLVTLHVPQRLEQCRYPRVDDYVKRQLLTYDNWQEELVSLAAHEARHIYQYRYDKQRSEVDAQRKALWAVERWREEQGRKERAG